MFCDDLAADDLAASFVSTLSDCSEMDDGMAGYSEDDGFDLEAEIAEVYLEHRAADNDDMIGFDHVPAHDDDAIRDPSYFEIGPADRVAA